MRNVSTKVTTVYTRNNNKIVYVATAATVLLDQQKGGKKCVNITPCTCYKRKRCATKLLGIVRKVDRIVNIVELILKFGEKSDIVILAHFTQY